jgi:hypothetical protein
MPQVDAECQWSGERGDQPLYTCLPYKSDKQGQGHVRIVVLVRCPRIPGPRKTESPRPSIGGTTAHSALLLPLVCNETRDATQVLALFSPRRGVDIAELHAKLASTLFSKTRDGRRRTQGMPNGTRQAKRHK